MTTAQLLGTGAWDSMLRGGSVHGYPMQSQPVVDMLHTITGEAHHAIAASVAAHVALMLATDADEYV